MTCEVSEGPALLKLTYKCEDGGGGLVGAASFGLQ